MPKQRDGMTKEIIVSNGRIPLEKNFDSNDLRNGDVMTASEVTQYLRIHRSTLFRLLKKKEIPAFRMGSDWRFSRQRIDRWRLDRQG
jgi:excisionase family DNA binding protein